MFYKNGDGVPAIPQDIEKAIYWFERSVEHGLVDAHWELAKIYASGAEGIPADMEKAVSHLTVVAESDNKNNIEAMRVLGSYYMDHGKGKDINLAFQWYDRAAKLGDFSSVHLATLTKSAIVPASLMAANHLNYIESWERALDDCEECQRCIEREEGYIDSGKYRVDQDWLNSLAESREDNAYNTAECLFRLKRYDEVYEKLCQSKSLKARILSTAAALCGSLRVSRGDLYQAVKELETNTTYDPQVEGSYVGEQAYAASMLFIANLHRDCGGRDLEISVNVLELAISILKDEQLKAALTDERRHYQPKLFGGYKYV
jgi:TPR repeat protein